MTDKLFSELINKQIIVYSYSVAKPKKIYQIIKRIIDIVLAFFGSLIGIPLLIIFSIIIKLESKGPAIYKQNRMGIYGEMFTIYKMRSMYIDAESNGPKWADKCDNRITKVGQFIRRTRIDEIPQLFNILKGDMSLVGPRPERLCFTHKFNQEISGFTNRLAVKPGLTGWAQVNGGYDITPEEKFRLDMEYIEKMSLIMDFKIIWKTVIIVLTGHGAR